MWTMPLFVVAIKLYQRIDIIHIQHWYDLSWVKLSYAALVQLKEWMTKKVAAIGENAEE